MWISDVPSQQIDPPAIYMAANTVTSKAGSAGSVYKLGVCQAINREIFVSPTSDAGMYFSTYMNQYFNIKPDGSARTGISIRIIEQPKHGRLEQEYPDATDYKKYHYKYIPDENFADFDHFVIKVSEGDITMQIYYTMSVGLPGEPTYVLDANGQRVDDLSRCPKVFWKISANLDTNGNTTINLVEYQPVDGTNAAIEPALTSSFDATEVRGQALHFTSRNVKCKA